MDRYLYTETHEAIISDEMVIDEQRESENIYFLNAVTESDLFALPEKDKEPEDE